MNRLLLLFFVFGLATLSYAQEDEIESISFGADFFRKETFPKPIVREVVKFSMKVKNGNKTWKEKVLLNTLVGF